MTLFIITMLFTVAMALNFQTIKRYKRLMTLYDVYIETLERHLKIVEEEVDVLRKKK